MKTLSVLVIAAFFLISSQAFAKGGGVSGGGNNDPAICLRAYQAQPGYDAELVTVAGFRDFLMDSECRYDLGYATCVAEAIIISELDVTGVKDLCGRN